MATLFDPSATSINGNRLGRGAMRFGGRKIVRTKRDMEEHGGFFNLDRLETDADKSRELEQNKQARDAARGPDTPNADVKVQKAYPLIQWLSWINGKRHLVEAAQGGKVIVRLHPLKTDYWPLVDSCIYPGGLTFLTPGCPDLTEDKQRQRAILQNYTLQAAMTSPRLQ
jgi:hypothetical protein